MMKVKLMTVLGLSMLMSCSSKQKQENASSTINPIIAELEFIKGHGILFGHQDDLAYGVNWTNVDGESDVKRVAGDYPSLFGWELGGIELDHSHNLDSVPFQEMNRLAVKGYEMGGINTFSWHPYSPIDSISSWSGDAEVVKHLIPGGSYHEQFKNQLDKLATFFQNLKDKNATPIPFIFRPWHEMDGTWFWWGSKACTSDEVKELFRFTIDYLKNKKGLTQMVVAYSPDRNFTSIDEYLTWYPGDDVIDIIGLDDYYDFKMPNGEKEVIKKLHLIIEYAKEKNKLVALTETGLENVIDSLWFTQKLGGIVRDSLIRNELSYLMVWRNDSKVHFFFPHENHPAAADAKSFLDQPEMLLLNDFNKQKNIKTNNLNFLVWRRICL